MKIKEENNRLKEENYKLQEEVRRKCELIAKSPMARHDEQVSSLSHNVPQSSDISAVSRLKKEQVVNLETINNLIGCILS